jgi:hypothetical protein
MEYQLVFLRSLRRLLVTASVVPSSPILVTLMKEELSSSETSVLARATRHNIPEGEILQKIILLQNFLKWAIYNFPSLDRLLLMSVWTCYRYESAVGRTEHQNERVRLKPISA